MADPLNDVSQKKDERKIKRDARKAGREAKRESIAGDVVSKEAGRYGIDLDNITSSPIGDAAKSKITEGVSQAVNAEKWGVTDKIAGFQKAAPGPVLEDRPVLDEEALKESARRQRKTRWIDALGALGAGLQGKDVDPRSTLAARFERERDTEFQNYRDITERNKQTKNLWEHQNRNELLNFVNKQIADEKVDKADKVKYEQIADQITAKNIQWEKEFGLDKRSVAVREESNRLRGLEIKGVTGDPAYDLKKKQFLLDVRQQEGKEAADKLTNTLKGFEAEITNLETEKFELQKEQENARRRDRDSFDPLIADIDIKIAKANKNIETSLKGNTSGTSTPFMDTIKEFQ